MLTERSDCRVCHSPLEDILDFGEQCLGGQFPLPTEPDPPRAPLVLCRCRECGLVQLKHTVSPEVMYSQYFYRSGISATMPRHLMMLQHEAVGLLRRTRPDHGSRVLDIGCNDGTFLSGFCLRSDRVWETVGIDPNGLWEAGMPIGGTTFIKGRFPDDFMHVGQFDLIFSVAMFYDVDDPVAFAQAVKKNLAPGGLWCVEVGSLGSVFGIGDYSSVCHEHLCYYTAHTLTRAAVAAKLWPSHQSFNRSNGGSIRMYFGHKATGLIPQDLAWEEDGKHFEFDVRQHRDELCRAVEDFRCEGKRIHLLGASTKMNTVLQWCGIDRYAIECASDRDPRKHGRVTPGTRIPIVSEEESRAMRPDAYLVGPWHFRDELIAREKDFLDRGGKMIFPFPKVEVVSRCH